jgi:hypothetical protein
MGMFAEIGNGKTMYFDNVIDFLEATENGFQSLVAKNMGQHIDPAVTKLESFENDEVEIDGLPDLPEEEYKGK